MSPRAFTEEEKQRVRQRLIDAAQRFLGTTGVRKTSVEDLAKAAGISKGAFYLFYDSKEILFMDAIDQAQQEIHESIIEGIRLYADKREGFIAVTLAMYRDFMSKPYLAALAGEDYQTLLTRIPHERVMAHIAEDDASSQRFIAELGLPEKADHKLLSAVLRMLFLGLMHRDEVGALADQAFEYALRAVADRLFKEGAQ
jgi:AcrR family transcriptional regulator